MPPKERLTRAIGGVTEGHRWLGTEAGGGEPRLPDGEDENVRRERASKSGGS